MIAKFLHQRTIGNHLKPIYYSGEILVFWPTCHSDTASEGQSEELANMLYRHTCLQHLIPFIPWKPMLQEKGGFIKLLCFFVKQGAWRPVLRRHQLHVQQRCPWSHKISCPFWKPSPSFIHRGQLVVNNMTSALGLMVKIVASDPAPPVCQAEK